MAPDQIFPVVNFIAVGCWLLLAARPGRHWPAVAAGVAVPAGLSAIYVAIVAITVPGAEGGFSSLQDVALLFTNPWLLLAGWIHYLAFDLLVGSWEANDARARGIPHVLLLPCLLLTFLFGPAGWLLYLGMRSARPAPLRARTAR